MDYEVRVDSDGTKRWYLGENLHRVDGPAIEYADGDKAWCFRGRRFKTKEAWFIALNEKDKMKALFSEHFMKE